MPDGGLFLTGKNFRYFDTYPQHGSATRSQLSNLTRSKTNAAMSAAMSLPYEIHASVSAVGAIMRATEEGEPTLSPERRAFVENLRVILIAGGVDVGRIIVRGFQNEPINIEEFKLGGASIDQLETAFQEAGEFLYPRQV